MRTITGALSQTLTTTTTLGLTTAKVNYVYLYAVDSDGAGTMKACLSSNLYDEGTKVSTVAESMSSVSCTYFPAK